MDLLIKRIIFPGTKRKHVWSQISRLSSSKLLWECDCVRAAGTSLRVRPTQSESIRSVHSLEKSTKACVYLFHLGALCWNQRVMLPAAFYQWKEGRWGQLGRQTSRLNHLCWTVAVSCLWEISSQSSVQGRLQSQLPCAPAHQHWELLCSMGAASFTMISHTSTCANCSS